MIFMNTATVKELTNLTDDQLDYLLERVELLQREKAQGKPREYSFRELVYIKLAAMMRHDRISFREVNGSLKLLERNWTNSEIPPVGSLMREREGDKVIWGWRPSVMMEKIIGKDANGENITEIITHIRRSLYMPKAFAVELLKVNQPELIPEESVMQFEPQEA